ncbi:hypothetical protein KL927_000737 [Ogataea polymorpha]|nr:hypothetical protein KL927_000737 [Ogataea polymorpha]
MTNSEFNNRSKLEEPIEQILSQNKQKILEILGNKYASDESLLLGTVSFAQSKLLTYILDNLNVPTASRVMLGKIVDRVWVDLHHPTIKIFQSQFRFLSKKKSSSKKQRPFTSVEIRKTFEHFVRFISKCYDFYISLVKEILISHDILLFVPVKKLTTTLKIDITIKEPRKSPSQRTIESLVYVISKCVLYIGDLSRYRALVAKTYLPTASISKEDNNNYSKSIELYKLALLILPSLGDPYNHIAIIDNLKEDSFNVVYNFIRSSLSSEPLPIGLGNLINYVSKKPNPMLRVFEAHNSTPKSDLTKNVKYELLRYQFLVLFDYYLLPGQWKESEGYLIHHHSIQNIETEFFKFMKQLDYRKQVFNDLYFKQLVILIGGFELLVDNNMVHPELDHSTAIIGEYLKFTFRFLDNMMQISLDNWNGNSEQPDLTHLLLPLVRLMLCWFKERELPRSYLIQTPKYALKLAQIVNNAVEYFRVYPDASSQVDANTRFKDYKPERKRLFKEDVTLKEFRPINYALDDFNDSKFQEKSETSVLALIGELPDESHKSMKLCDYVLRMISVAHMGIRILSENKVDLQFDHTTQLFLIPDSKVKPFSKKRTKPLEDGKLNYEENEHQFVSMVDSIVSDHEEDLTTQPVSAANSPELTKAPAKTAPATSPPIFPNIWSNQPLMANLQPQQANMGFYYPMDIPQSQFFKPTVDPLPVHTSGNAFNLHPQLPLADSFNAMNYNPFFFQQPLNMETMNQEAGQTEKPYNAYHQYGKP